MEKNNRISQFRPLSTRWKNQLRLGWIGRFVDHFFYPNKSIFFNQVYHLVQNRLERADLCTYAPMLETHPLFFNLRSTKLHHHDVWKRTCPFILVLEMPIYALKKNEKKRDTCHAWIPLLRSTVQSVLHRSWRDQSSPYKPANEPIHKIIDIFFLL